MYKLSDCTVELISRSFYEHELALIKEGPRKDYIVENILVTGYWLNLNTTLKRMWDGLKRKT